MKKYFRVFLLYLQELTEYRFNLVGQSLMWFIPLLGFYYVWQTIYSQRDFFGSYSKEQMITYYLLISFLSGMIQSSSYWPISEDIERGELTKYLLRPVNYLLYHFSLSLARRFTRVVIILFLIGILKIFLPGIIIAPSSFFLILAFFLSVILAFGIYYLFAAILGFSAFWLIRTMGIIYSFEMLMMFFSGLFVPLDLLPDFFKRIASLLPFKYGLYFSVKIFLADLTLREVFSGLGLQVFWILVLAVSSYWLWRKGLKNYEGVGI